MIRVHGQKRAEAGYTKPFPPILWGKRYSTLPGILIIDCAAKQRL